MSYGSIFVRMFNKNDVEIHAPITDFTYNHSESANDGCRIVIEIGELGNVRFTDVVDHPDLQEDKKLKLTWGYIKDYTEQRRVVYIWDITTEFTDNGIRMEIEAYPKAAYLYLIKSRDLYKDTNLLGMAETIGNSWGLEVENLIDKDDSIVEEDTSDQIRHDSGGVSPATYNVESNGNQNVIIPVDNATTRKTYVFKNYDEIPQAGKSDAQVLGDTAKLEGNENTLVNFRDDKLIIDKRDLAQEPHKTFNYKAEPGDVIVFRPGSRNMDARSAGVSNLVSGWDADSKEFIESWITEDQDSSEAMGENIELTLNQLALNLVRNENFNPYRDNVMIGGHLIEAEVDEVDENGNKLKKIISTRQLDVNGRNYTNIRIGGTTPGVVDLEHNFFTQAQDTTGRIFVQGIANVEARDIINTVENNPDDVAAAGLAKKSKWALEQNESELVVVGDPELESNKVITMLNVGKRYSGNYYVANVEHRLNQMDGYICTLKLYRRGINDVGETNPNKVGATTLNIDNNNKVDSVILPSVTITDRTGQE